MSEDIRNEMYDCLLAIRPESNLPDTAKDDLEFKRHFEQVKKFFSKHRQVLHEKTSLGGDPNVPGVQEIALADEAVGKLTEIQCELAEKAHQLLGQSLACRELIERLYVSQ